MIDRSNLSLVKYRLYGWRGTFTESFFASYRFCACAGAMMINKNGSNFNIWITFCEQLDNFLWTAGYENNVYLYTSKLFWTKRVMRINKYKYQWMRNYEGVVNSRRATLFWMFLFSYKGGCEYLKAYLSIISLRSLREI